MSITDRHDFVRALLDLYLRLPLSAAPRPSRNDRSLAGQLFDRSVPFELIQAALLLATLRRSTRPPDSPPLPPIRSLHYFLPVIHELLASPPHPDYVRYLHRRLRAITNRPNGHFSTLPHGR